VLPLRADEEVAAEEAMRSEDWWDTLFGGLSGFSGAMCRAWRGAGNWRGGLIEDDDNDEG
jgi:catalase (peroxidase I)